MPKRKINIGSKYNAIVFVIYYILYLDLSVLFSI